MNRALPVILSVALVAVGGAAISYGGSRLLQQETASVDVPLETVDLSEIDLSDSAEENPVQTAQAETVQSPSAEPTQPPVEILDAPEGATGQGYERVEPRPPLSEFYGAPTRKPETKAAPGEEQRRLTRMFNPIAVAAGRIEVRGYKIALAGIEPLSVDEKCDWNGTEWHCGAAARTAFRSWMRSRAIQCKVPDTPDAQEIRAECHIGTSDISDWLISNGWARPEPGGPYEEAGSRARTEKKGIYGEPPRRVNLTIVPNPAFDGDPAAGILDADPAESTPDELNQDPAPGFTPPVDPGATTFPPKPTPEN